MAKIKRLILGMIPNQKCNLKCEYCYISQVQAWDEPTALHYSPEYIAKCLSVERLGGISLINLTGNGETMLQPDIVPLVSALLREGHYVEIVTNGTVTRNIDCMLELPKDSLNRLFFKISFHYLELKRNNQLNVFFDNIKKIHSAGASFTVELMAYDAIEDEIEDIKAICLDNIGAFCHTTIGRNDSRRDKALLSKHSIEKFRDIWCTFESPMTEFKLDVIGVKRKEFCYAGLWSLFVNLYTGESQSCYWQPYNQNLFVNPEKPIKFVPVGHACTQPYCTNAHSHLCWGLIPELETPKYSEMRNREILGGGEWLTKDCNNFFSTKLSESNVCFSKSKQVFHRFTYPLRLIKWFLRDWKHNLTRISNYMKRLRK